MVPLTFIAYPLLCFTIDIIDWSNTNKKESNFNFSHHKKAVYKNWFNPTHGLELSSGKNMGHRFNENGVLFYVQWLLLLDEFDQIETKDRKTFNKLVKDLESFKDGKKIKGIYDRGEKESFYQDNPDLISHDNITAIVAGSSLFNMDFGSEVASYGLKNFMNFDNSNIHNFGLANLQVHPRDWFFWLRSSKNIFHNYLSYFAYPVFLISAIEDPLNHIKCRPVWWKKYIKMKKFKKYKGKGVCFLDSSGPLLWYVRYQSLHKKSGLVSFTNKLSKGLYHIHYGKDWKSKIFKTYYKDPNHPNRVLVAIKKKLSSKKN
tara:strand:- start:1718 stop:2668 length:951 start_codon:yes stop_codon:yes gene_type:complete